MRNTTSSTTQATHDGQAIIVTRVEQQTTQTPSALWFTGHVQVTQLFPARDGSRTSGGLVTFEPGARSAWHTHPYGQTLLITAGVGRVQEWGQPIQEFKAGDVVWIPPGVKHWHGASPTTGMTHIAIQEVANGSAVDWLEHVTDEQYNGPVAPATPTTKQQASDLELVSPALQQYTRDRLDGELWKRPGLSPRDRSIVTLSVLVARNQTAALPAELERALANGVKPAEVSELITHLAFYSGWGNAIGAADAAKVVFARRGIGPDQLTTAGATTLPLDEAAEAKRAASVEANFGKVAPGVVQYTTDALFRDLWLRPGLAPRDRSLVTVSDLIATGQVAQVTYHLNRAMDNGLTQSEAAETMTQLAFYAGWPNVFTAMPVVKDVFEKRGK